MTNNQPPHEHEPLFLYVILLGCRPAGRNIEQHDIMFGAAKTLLDLTHEMKTFWYKTITTQASAAVKKMLPGFDARGFAENFLTTLSRRDKVHIDAWMKVEYVDGYKISIAGRHKPAEESEQKLYFINLGGYKAGEFEEFHKKLFLIATGLSDVRAQILSHPFMTEYCPAELGNAGKSHIDDQYKIDFEADDIVCVNDVIGSNYKIVLQKTTIEIENETAIGYLPLDYKKLS